MGPAVAFWDKEEAGGDPGGRMLRASDLTVRASGGEGRDIPKVCRMSSIAGFDWSREFGSDRPRSMENIHTIVAEFYLSVTVSSPIIQLRVCSGIHKTPNSNPPAAECRMSLLSIIKINGSFAKWSIFIWL